MISQNQSVTNTQSGKILKLIKNAHRRGAWRGPEDCRVLDSAEGNPDQEPVEEEEGAQAHAQGEITLQIRKLKMNFKVNPLWHHCAMNSNMVKALYLHVICSVNVLLVTRHNIMISNIYYCDISSINR